MNSKKMTILKTLFLLLILFIFAECAFAWNAKIINIHDGDTITALNNNKQIKIRLYGIDAPELGQDFGQRARQVVTTLTYGKNATIDDTGLDKYGRTIGKVWVDGIDINEILISAGLAWVYKQYCTEQPTCTDWTKREQEAKDKKLGLWAGPNPIPPWEWRHVLKTTYSNSTPHLEAAIYHGNVSSRIFHRTGCKYYNCLNCIINFYNREDAIKSGFKPCRVCNP